MIVYLSPSDDVAVQVATLSAGDTAVLLEGTYNVSGNVLANGVEIRARKGVIIEAAGDLFVGSVDNFMLTGYAVINSGNINLDCDQVTFICDKLQADSVSIKGSSVSMRTVETRADVDLGGQVTYESYLQDGAIRYTAGADNTPSSFDIQYLYSGLFETLSDRCYIDLSYGGVLQSIGTIAILNETRGTVNVRDCINGNFIHLDLESRIIFNLKGNPPDLELLDEDSTMTIQGDITDTLVIIGDATVRNLTIVSETVCIDSPFASVVSVAENVKMSSAGLQVGANITLTDGSSGGGGVTVHNALTGRDLADGHPIKAITGLQTALNDKADLSVFNTHISSNVHLSKAERDAINNTPSTPNALNPFATQADLAAGGNGDMLKSVYDQNGNNIVDNSERLGGQLPSYYEQAFLKNTAFNKNFGTVAGTVAQGNHDHAGVYEPAFNKKTAFNRDFGVSAGTVSEGNHLHEDVYEPADSNIQKHITDTSTNPHQINSNDVGLGNVANLAPSDLPISDDTQAALNSKLNTNTFNTHVASNVHLSTSERAAITNTPTPPTGANPFATQADLAAGGNGDMLKSVYDQNGNSIVDDSERLGGQLPSFYETIASGDEGSVQLSDANNKLASLVSLRYIFAQSSLQTPNIKLSAASFMTPTDNDKLLLRLHNDGRLSDSGYTFADLKSMPKTVWLNSATTNNGDTASITDFSPLNGRSVKMLRMRVTGMHSSSVNSPDYNIRAEFRVFYGANNYRSALLIPAVSYRGLYYQADIELLTENGTDYTVMSVQTKNAGSTVNVTMSYLRLTCECILL